MSKLRLIQIVSIILALTGTYLLAFGLIIKGAMNGNYRKKTGIDKTNLFSPCGAIKHPGLFRWGLALITISGLIQIFLVFC